MSSATTGSPLNSSPNNAAYAYQISTPAQPPMPVVAQPGDVLADLNFNSSCVGDCVMLVGKFYLALMLTSN